MNTNEINFDGRFTVEGYRGIAFYLLGYVENVTEETEWTGMTETDTEWARAVMVGDDRVHEIEVEDLTEISEDDYCSGCGQTGCNHG